MNYYPASLKRVRAQIVPNIIDPARITAAVVREGGH